MIDLSDAPLTSASQIIPFLCRHLFCDFNPVGIVLGTSLESMDRSGEVKEALRG